MSFSALVAGRGRTCAGSPGRSEESRFAGRLDRRTRSVLEERPGFVGRTRELGDLTNRLSEPGLTTLKGPAGIGKSRLAATAARTWHLKTDHQAWFCELAEARSAEALVYTVARTLDVPLQSGDPHTTLTRALAGRGPLLLVLDNFEQLVDQAEALDSWLKACPELRLLVTSRVPLGVDDEAVLEVAPLDARAAVQLLVDRARERGAEIADDPDLPELAKRLDGLPLALELAAGRLGVLSVAEVLERLGLGLLRDGDGGRHGTLRAALEWSWELLSPTERAVLAQLSVFRGGFAVEAVEEIVDTEANVLEVLDSLVNHSMVAAQPDGRMDLLVGIREFAQERVHAPELSSRHGEYFSRYGTPEAMRALDRHGGVEHRARLSRDLANVIEASRQAVDRGDSDVAARTAMAAWRILGLTGPHDVGRSLLEDALALGRHPPDVRGRLLAALGTAQHNTGAIDLSPRTLERSIEQLAQTTERYFLAIALCSLANIRRDRGQFDATEELLGRAGKIAEETHDDRLRGYVGVYVAGLSMNRGRSDAARTQFEDALEKLRRAGDLSMQGICVGNLGIVHAQEGRMELAREHFEAGLELSRLTGNRSSAAVVLGNLGIHHHLTGQLEEARACFTEALVLLRAIGNRTREGTWLNSLGLIHQDLGELDRAQALLEDALVFHRASGNRRLLTNVLGNLGNNLTLLGRHDEARTYLMEALTISRKLGNPRQQAQSLAYLGQLEEAEGHLDEAKALLDEAEALLRTGEYPIELTKILCGQVEVALKRGDLDAAHARLSEAEVLADRASLGPESQLERLVRRTREHLRD